MDNGATIGSVYWNPLTGQNWKKINGTTIQSTNSPDELGTPEASEVPESLSPEPEYSPEPENTLEAPEATQEVENTQVESGGGSTPEISEPTQKPEGGTESKATETNHEESKATESSSEESK